MRINLSKADGGTMTGPGDVYAKEISGAGNAFAYSIYEHSKLPLRVFEAARIATAMINGCMICMNWQSKRDVHQMGISEAVKTVFISFQKFSSADNCFGSCPIP